MLLKCCLCESSPQSLRTNQYILMIIWVCTLKAVHMLSWLHIEQFIAKREVKLIGNDIKSTYVTSWHEDLQNKPSCQSLYKHIKFVHEPEFYLKKLPES